MNSPIATLPTAPAASLPLTPRNVRLAATARDKTEAIRAVGHLLVEGGYIESGYIDSMLARERQANTFLGHGIAIPHGQQADRGLIHRTGIAILQLPEGVEWNSGQRVRVVVGIAARSDEHLEILAALTDVLDDPTAAENLATTREPDALVAALHRHPPVPATSAPELEWAGALAVDVVLRGHAGLHARPATAFCEIAGRFAADIRVHHGGRVANGKAMASLLRLGAESGATLRLEARGSDADTALAVLREAVEHGLGEAAEALPAVEGQAWTPPEPAPRAFAGVAAVPGLAIGPVFRLCVESLEVVDAPSSPATERRRLDQVLAEACGQLQRLHDESAARPGAVEGEIFRAHQALLNDSELRAEVTALIDAGHSAPWSWQQIIAARVCEVQQLKNERLAGRAADFRDVGRRVLQLLAGVATGQLALPTEPCILIAEDLTPTDTAQLDPKIILGLCTAAGGPTSHTAIIARARGIPAVVGAGSAILDLADGLGVILDGSAGRLYAAPDEAALASARRFQATWQRGQDLAAASRFRPAMLTDGRRVEVVANIGAASEAAAAVEAGAEGVGLLRTEFLFLGRESAPSEDEQCAAYGEMVRALNGLPLIIRTLDIGGDKVVPYLGLAKEENPFLGVRGIRLCLRHPALFRTQLRAIYRAAAAAEPGAVRIMFPMITTLEDWRAGKALAEDVRRELATPVLELGIMVEVPSVVLMAREFAREVDFFSIGTNDLTQYALAIDRQHPDLGKEADALHPAVLRLIDLTVRAAAAEGKWVGVCGGAAGDLLGAAILTGLGVTELSMSTPAVAGVKAHLRGFSWTQVRALAQRALACATAREVRALTGRN